MSSNATNINQSQSSVLPKNERTPTSSSSNHTLPSPSSVKISRNDSFDPDNQRRRSSSRSIKRKKFDDELVDSMSTSYPKQQKPLIIKSEDESSITEHIPPIVPVIESLPVAQPTPPSISKKVKSSVTVTTPSPAASSSSVAKKKNKKQSTITHRSLSGNNFWKPTDDLALIINVEQTNDLKKVHDGVKFSTKFTYRDIESRWRSLMYVPSTKSLALAAIRQLHADIVHLIESKALFSEAEEKLLKKIESRKVPSLESLQELIDTNAQVFLASRTPKILLKHWRLLRHYNSLDDQTLQPLPRHESVVSFSEIENIVKEELKRESKNPETAPIISSENLNQEIAPCIRKTMLEIRMLENELPKYQALLDSITGVAPSDFDNQTYAVLRGRTVRYLMRSTEITIGRMTKDFVVDVDLSLEGPASSISRLQAVINLQKTGELIIFNTGKRPIYIDSKPLLSNSSLQIHHNSLIEISSLKFIFLINQDLVFKMRNELLQSCK